MNELNASDETRPPGRKRGWPFAAMTFLGVLIAAYFVWNALYFFPYIVDDTFISLRYAENLVLGDGLVYNPGRHVEGYSNFFWVMLQAVVYSLGWPVIDVMKFLALALGVATIGITFALGRRLWPHGTPFADCKTMLAVALLGLNTSLAVWAQAGLETVLLAALLTATVWRYEVELEKPAAWPVSALLFGLAWMTRPETAVYALYFVVRRFMLKRDRPLGSTDLKWLTVFAVIVVPYEVWGLWYYGALLPATHGAKIGPGMEGLAQSLGEWARQPALGKFLTQQGWGLPALLGLAAAGVALGRRVPAAAWVVSLSGLIFVLYAHDDWMPRHRLFVPILPFIFLLLGHGLGELLRWSQRRRWMFALCVLLCAVAVAEYARVQCFVGTTKDDKITKRSRGLWFSEVPGQLKRRDYPVVGPARFILKQVPPGEWVVLRDIGFPGYLSRNPIWDTLGLVTPTVIRARANGHDEAVFEELLAVRPGGFWLVLKDRNAGSLSHRIDDWLQSDPTASALWKQVVNTPGKSSRRVAYLRRDLPAFDLEARNADVTRRFPEYGHKLN